MEVEDIYIYSRIKELYDLHCIIVPYNILSLGFYIYEML